MSRPKADGNVASLHVGVPLLAVGQGVVTPWLDEAMVLVGRPCEPVGTIEGLVTSGHVICKTQAVELGAVLITVVMAESWPPQRHGHPWEAHPLHGSVSGGLVTATGAQRFPQRCGSPGQLLALSLSAVAMTDPALAPS
jgi:hypothetical protein